MPSIKEQLGEHLEATYPSSRESYLGKEHFWALGEEIGMPQPEAGRVFNAFCFPIKTRIWLPPPKNVQVVDPIQLGLSVKDRGQIGMPVPKIGLSAIPPNKSVIARGIFTISEFSKLTINTVVQMRGVIELAERLPTVDEADFSDRVQRAAQRLMPRMLEFDA